MKPMLRLSVWMEVLAASWRERRTDEGGVADEAAMLAVLLTGAVAIAAIVMSLISDAEDKLADIVIPG